MSQPVRSKLRNVVCPERPWPHNDSALNDLASEQHALNDPGPKTTVAGPEGPASSSIRRNHTASAPASPVRMRIIRSTGVTQILPSPILPVCAALTMASVAGTT